VERLWTVLADNWLALLVGFGGIIATIAVYWFTRRVKEPVWSAHTTDLVTKRTGELPGLAVEFKGKSISDLSVSRVVFFNRGSDPIRRADIAPAARLAVTVPKDVTILDASLVTANNRANRMGIALDKLTNTAPIDFDYLSKNDGAVFDIVHFGGVRASAAVTGAIIGASGVRYINIRKADPSLLGGLFVATLLTLALAVGGLLVAYRQELIRPSTFLGPSLAAAFTGAAIPLGIASATVLFQATRMTVPKGLGVFNERRYR
jgi:hypothetical protein